MPSPCSSNQILVAGSSNEDLNGIYTYDENTLGFVQGDGDNFQLSVYQFNRWALVDENGVPVFSATIQSNCPVGLQASDWIVTGFGVPGTPPTSITAYPATPSEPTFGLPADVAALITSRFGSVARFLRLRNLGQV